jgi:hypothetical protein
MMNKLLIVLLIGTLWACENKTPERKDTTILKLELQPNTYFGVGYGEVYACHVLDVLEGDFTSDSLLLTILAGDTLNSNIMASSKNKLVIRFKKNKENEPYPIMPISGTVDAQKTSWLIREIEPKEN